MRYETLVETEAAAITLSVQAPVGVGFSYADDQGLYTIDDWTVAQDNYDGIQQFFNSFPQYRNNSFFTFGESYGGGKWGGARM